MKVVLDLKDNINNFMVKDKEELRKYIEDMKHDFNKLYLDTLEDGERFDFVSDEEHNRFFDILVFFENYEIVEEDLQ